MVNVTVDNVQVLPGGINVVVGGGRPRVVTALASWESALSELVTTTTSGAAAPGAFLFMDNSTQSPSLRLHAFLLWTRGHIPAPVAQRLRATWLVTHLSGHTPLQPLLDAAGITTADSLIKYLPHLPALPDDQRQAVLRSAEGRAAT